MPNTNRTKQELAESLKALMQTIPLERISVSDIVEHAGLGRNTFYYHFQDKYALVNWIFESEATGLLRQRLTAENWDAQFHAIEDYLRANKVFYCNALAYSGQNSLKDYIYDTVRAITIERGQTQTGPKGRRLTEDELGTVGDVVACAFLGLLIHWAQGGMQDDTKNFHECLRFIADGSLARCWLSSGE